MHILLSWWHNQYKKNLNPNKIKADEKSYKNSLNYYIGYVTVKGLRHMTINSANPLYLIINKISRYIEESNGDKYLMLVPTDIRKRHTKNVWTTMDQNKRSY